MTRSDDFIGQLESYLDEYEGNTPLPEAIRDAIRAELPSTQQRPAWWPRTFWAMNNMAKLGLATAAVVVAALIGYAYLIAPNIGSQGPDEPSPTPTPRPLPVGQDEAGTLDAGTYRLSGVDLVNATLTVPEGWGNTGGIGVGDVAADTAFIAIWPSDSEVAHVFADPCHWQDGYVDPPVGPTVDDLATALANQPQRGEAEPVDVSIDGYSGKLIELSVPNDVEFADCDGGEFYSWEGRFQQEPGQIDRVYILDVGGQRVVVDVTFGAGTSEADLTEQQAILDSIQLEAP